MTAEILLNRLDKVRETGPSRWLALCPAHDDKHPSLSIRETPDGRVLIHCFSHQCPVDAIVAAVGLTLSDLFPERFDTPQERQQRREYFHAADVLKAVAFEVLVVDCAVGTLQRQGYLTDSECERLALASDRLQSAVSLVGVDHG